MKKLFTNLKVAMTLLLLCGVCSAWGEEKSFDITINNFTEITTSYTTTFTHEYTVESSTVKVEAYGVYKNTNGIQMNSGKGTYIKNTTPIPGYITKIVVNWSATGKNSPTLYVNKGSVASTGSTSLGKGSNTTKEQTYTITNPSTSQMNYFYFDGTTVTGACYAAITVYYESVPSKTLSSIAVKTAPTKVTYTEGETFAPEGLVVTGTYDDSSTEDIEYAGNESDFDFSPTLATPLRTTDKSVTITYGGKSVSQTITVIARPAYTVTLSDDSSNPLTETYGGAGVVLPERTPTNLEYTFAGWSTTNVSEETTTAPAIIPVGTYHPISDVTIYPVFKRTVSSGESTWDVVTNASSLAAGDVVIIANADGTKALGAQSANNFAAVDITVKNDQITSVGSALQLTLETGLADKSFALKTGSAYLYAASSSNNYLKTRDDITNDASFTISIANKAATITAQGTNTRKVLKYNSGSSVFSCYASGQALPYIYKKNESSTIYYTSNPAAVTVKTPTFTPANGTKFASSLDVTIACATEDATIKYSTDNGTTWNDYSAAINITETTTIQAKAVKENAESDVVSATYTQLAGILSMKTNGAGTYKLTDAVVTYVNGSNAMIQDATAGAYLYGCATGLAVGDVFNGDVTVTTNAYKGLFEITAFDITEATKTSDPTKVVPTVVTAANLVNTSSYNMYECMLVTIKNATVTSAFSGKQATIEQDETSVTLYDQFSQNLEAQKDAVVDVTGYLGKYNDVQFWVKSQDDIKVNSAGKKTSTIKFTTAENTYNVNDMDEFEATAYDEEGVARTDDYTITYTSSDNKIAEIDEGYILAYAPGTVTITASTPATDTYAAAEATFDIRVLPEGTVWYEDFTGMETSDVKDKYSTTGTITVYEQTTSGGTAPEILLNGTMTVDLSSKNITAGIYTLTFNSNNGATISVTGGEASSAVKDANNEKLWSAQINVSDPATFAITFTRSSNSRLDNFCLAYDHACETQNVTISSVGWATAYLPFNAKITSGNATAYYVTGTSGTALEKVEAKVIPAKTGVLLKSNNGGEATVTFTESTETVDDATGNMMVGSLTGETFADEGTTYYILANDETLGGLGFYYQVDNGVSATCDAGKAVLAIPTGSSAKAFFSLFDEADGIEAIHNSQCRMQNTQYNLNGMRVNGNYKGIVIINGKKVVK